MFPLEMHFWKASETEDHVGPFATRRATFFDQPMEAKALLTAEVVTRISNSSHKKNHDLI
jgi:hypothetical protein